MEECFKFHLNEEVFHIKFNSSYNFPDTIIDNILLINELSLCNKDREFNLLYYVSNKPRFDNLAYNVSIQNIITIIDIIFEKYDKEKEVTPEKMNIFKHVITMKFNSISLLQEEYLKTPEEYWEQKLLL